MLFLFLTPLLVCYVVLFIFPSAQAFQISLYDWSGFTSTMRFTGLKNFRMLLGDTAFWGVAFKNSMGILFGGGAVIFAIAFAISGALSTNIRGKKLMRAIIFFPSVMSPVAVAILWSFLYNDKWGLFNNILRGVGLTSAARTWMAPATLFNAILAALIWMNSGFYCVILMAALDRIPEHQIEAAKIEGANELQVFFRIKLPMIKDIISTCLTLWAINAIKEFGLLFAWGGGVATPPDGATNLAVKMYITAFGRRVSVFEMGYATAMGVVMFLVIVVMVFAVSRVMRSDVFEY